MVWGLMMHKEKCIQRFNLVPPVPGIGDAEKRGISSTPGLCTVVTVAPTDLTGDKVGTGGH